jgi:hypothetical protein
VSYFAFDDDEDAESTMKIFIIYLKGARPAIVYDLFFFSGYLFSFRYLIIQHKEKTWVRNMLMKNIIPCILPNGLAN